MIADVGNSISKSCLERILSTIGTSRCFASELIEAEVLLSVLGDDAVAVASELLFAASARSDAEGVVGDDVVDEVLREVEVARSIAGSLWKEIENN